MYQTKLNLKGAQLTMQSSAQKKLRMHLFLLIIITKEEKYLSKGRQHTIPNSILIKFPLIQLIITIEIADMYPEKGDSRAKAITKQ